MTQQWAMLLLSMSFFLPVRAAFIDFQNCLSLDIQTSKPQRLQFQPKFLWAAFDTQHSSHNLNVTVYGNVTGQATDEDYPPADSPRWGNDNDTFGKIVDVNKETNLASTLKARFNVLDYTPYVEKGIFFCNTTINGRCPLAPIFRPRNASDPQSFHAFSVAHDLYSTYSFTTITSTVNVVSGDKPPTTLACISANITPDLGSSLSNILQYLPLVVLVFVAAATASAAVLSPWGSADIFRFTTNYGRDDDLLRLVTPGFGDCLQYIQFIILAGSLSLDYPGFYQPVVSQVGWASLMFNQSFVSHGNGTQSIRDGIYAVNGSYGLHKTSQLVGMTAEEDIWAGAMVWLLVIIASVVVLIQIGFLGRWVYRLVSRTRSEDLREKNLPFTTGNAIRIIFNYFLLPVVALSMYQLMVAKRSPAVTVALAAILLVALVLFAGYLLWLVASTRPRSYLFDDLPTVLLYGPLYNTYSDNAATFALVPIISTFVRGIAIGAVQPSGIAQLVLLAICEVILILTLNAFRPFHSPTSMNAFHTFFAVVRLLTVLLSVAFVPSLRVGNAARGWIGYVILLMHAIVLVFGFFLNALQTLIEVLARLAGAGGEEGVGSGAARGGLVKVFGMRQLSRRNPRRKNPTRQSMSSDAAILGPENDRRSFRLSGGRSRSVSASSGFLLNKSGTNDHRSSMGLESVSAAGHGPRLGDNDSAPYTPSTGAGASAFSYLPGPSQQAGPSGSGGGGIVNLARAEAADPYFRPPRQRRATNEALALAPHSEGSMTSVERANRRWSEHSPDHRASPNRLDPPSVSGRATPVPAYLTGLRDRSDSNADDQRRGNTDYATREVDFYYGVRGPALSNMPTRRLKTGPGDPTGPVSSARGWFKGLFGGKTKETGKGFEVVRSSRVPPATHRDPSGALVAGGQGPYTDNPEPGVPAERKRDLALSDDGDAIGAGTRHLPGDDNVSPLTSDNGGSLRQSFDDDDAPSRSSQLSQFPPSLPTIDTGGGIELPSRIASKASSRPPRQNTRPGARTPSVPRKSSQRIPQHAGADIGQQRLSPVTASPRASRLYDPDRQHIHDALHDPSYGAPSIAQRQSNPATLISLDNEGHSDAAEHTRHSSSVLPAQVLGDNRPQSLGYVQQHRISDNYHAANPEGTIRHGSVAELVDEGRDGAPGLAL